MKPYSSISCSVVMVALIPCVLFSLSGMHKQRQYHESSSEIEQKQQIIRVYDNGSVKELDLDDYIVAVLLGEMPDNFELDTLMAQAVATRTYTLRRVNSQLKHENADVCTNHACCQAYCDPQKYQNTQFLQNVRKAVEMTSSQVLMFDGNLIEATYFSCSGGKTEDAVSVWGTDIPYLKSVESPGEENAAYYEHSIEQSREEFLTLLGLPENLLIYNDSIELTYTNGGGVEQLTIGDAVFSGVQLRVLLNLPSTAFTLYFTPDNVIITTRGNGHRVGMSQYGADAMAVSGHTYSEILMHYYPGTELVTLNDEQIHAVFDKVENL